MRQMPLLNLLGRVWLPLVIVLVLAGGGYAVVQLHGAFGSQERPSYARGAVADAATAASKQVVYEVFGPVGTVAAISYFDIDASPQQISGAALPWTLTLTSNRPGMIGSVVAQGDGDRIGCRILVDGQLRAEKVTNQAHAFTHCLVTGA